MNNAEWDKLCKPLHLVFSGELAATIRQFAQAQGVTYAGIVRQSVKHTMKKDGGETIPVPFGEPDYLDCYDATDEEEDE